MDDDVVIRVSDVKKDFVLPHEKVNSLKGHFTRLFRPNRTTEVQHALRGISFDVKKGEFFGIVGRNGSGKSTLLKVLAGIYQPTKGSVMTRGKLVPFIELGVGFNPELTGRENVYLNGALLGFSTKEMDEQYDRIVEFAELERFMDQKLKNYSSGMQVRLAFSVAIIADADILLVDEVLAVGDADFRRKCYEYFKSLKRNKKTVIFVSHDMQAVQEYCDRAMHVSKGKINIIGNTFDVAKAYDLENVAQTRDIQTRGEEPEGPVFVDSCIALDDKGGQKNSFYADEGTISLQFRLGAKKMVENAVLGVTVVNTAGTPIVAASTNDIGARLPRMEPGQKKDIILKLQNVFNDGEYTVRTNIRDGETKAVYSVQAGLCAFSVVGRKNTYGLVHPNMEVTIK